MLVFAFILVRLYLLGYSVYYILTVTDPVPGDSGQAPPAKGPCDEWSAWKYIRYFLLRSMFPLLYTDQMLTSNRLRRNSPFFEVEVHTSFTPCI